MGKTAKPKTRQISTHSRAARRAASPSIDAPTAAKPSNLRTTRSSTSPDAKTAKPHILAASTGSGISKRASKSKPLKRAQRLRQVEAAERAEENNDKLALKVAKSLGREKKVKERRKGWEDINEAKRKKAAKANAFGALGGDDEGEGKAGEWVTLGDLEMDGADAGVVGGVDAGDNPPGPVGALLMEEPQLQAIPLPDDVDPDI
ncbi:hypothetical protein P171DRAFT_526062 [Karstenula rhodostoma CBS 690.94]|uniref:Ribosome biogenesis protein Alb1 n=1 Tax=Karstenula rhodostoma CBS 690.94 TaxID=1392251 RepID=A0A9P4P4T6_9PLEO|nr:hypothetical protein P171DRAFT_526062 [Karstenula rhodostoma CBS 690.94]